MAEATQQKDKLVGRILKDMDKVTESQVQEALAIQKESGGAVGGILLDLGYIEEEDLTVALAQQSGMEVVDLNTMELPEVIINHVSPSIAHAYQIIPVNFENGVLTVALSDPTKLKTLDDLRFLLDCEVRGAVSNENDINKALDKYYGSEDNIESVLEELDAQTEEIPDYKGTPSESIDLESLEEMAHTAPVRRLLNLVLLQAIQDRASDIHFEPFEDEFKIRYRVDGILYEMVPPPRHLHVALATRIKAMSGMDIAERRLPQDGRVELNISGNPVDLRISTLPTMFGESVVCRVLDRRQVSLDIDKLGLRSGDKELVEEMIRKPHGIVLCTGPTGCGKTTTLYSVLRELNNVGVKILTAEDPVEYDIEGIMQMQINPKIDVTFAKSLRHFLRQDPDIILIGEIRDLDTAQIAVQAALTGHMVFSTSHTNDAATSLTRLVDLGLEPYLINASLEGVIAQRLVRKICTNCKEEYEPTEESLLQLGLDPEDVKDKKFYRGRGCQLCNNIGYKGRLGIFEILNINDEIRDLLTSGASTGEVRMCARKHGARSLRQSGLLAIYDGLTTVEEVARATATEV